MNKKKIIISAAAAVVVLAGGAYISYNALTSLAISKKNFPDKIFRNYVAEKFDKDHNKFLSDKEISQAVEILQQYQGQVIFAHSVLRVKSQDMSQKILLQVKIRPHELKEYSPG